MAIAVTRDFIHEAARRFFARTHMMDRMSQVLLRVIILLILFILSEDSS
jgi:hypothetical protein